MAPIKHLRITCLGTDGTGPEMQSMTSITVTFDETETNFRLAKAKALGVIVAELCRYGLHEALNAIGILDEYGQRRKAELEGRLPGSGKA
jgi:hypothetical protein